MLKKFAGFFSSVLVVPVGLLFVLLCGPLLVFFSESPLTMQEKIKELGCSENCLVFENAGILLKASGFFAFFFGFLFLAKPLTAFWGIFAWIPVAGIFFKALQKAIWLAVIVVAFALGIVLTFLLSIVFSLMKGIF